MEFAALFAIMPGQLRIGFPSSLQMIEKLIAVGPIQGLIHRDMPPAIRSAQRTICELPFVAKRYWQ